MRSSSRHAGRHGSSSQSHTERVSASSPGRGGYVPTSQRPSTPRRVVRPRACTGAGTSLTANRKAGRSSSRRCSSVSLRFLQPSISHRTDRARQRRTRREHEHELEKITELSAASPLRRAGASQRMALPEGRREKRKQHASQDGIARAGAHGEGAEEGAGRCDAHIAMGAIAARPAAGTRSDRRREAMPRRGSRRSQ